eukprot:213195_1
MDHSLNEIESQNSATSGSLFSDNELNEIQTEMELHPSAFQQNNNKYETYSISNLYSSSRTINRYTNLPDNFAINQLYSDQFMKPDVASQWILTWNHIASALSHELYDELSSVIITIVTEKHQIYSNQVQQLQMNVIDDLLINVKKKINICNEEIVYIKSVIERAITFYAHQATKTIPDQKIEHIKSASKLIDDNHHGLTFDLLEDIYTVHNCFLSTNYHSKCYNKEELIQNIENS